MNAWCCRALCLWLTIGSVVCAADFWQSKPSEAWSEKEVRRLLSDSPWAIKVDALSTDTNLAHRVGGLAGGRVGGLARIGRAGAGGGVGGDGAGNLGGGSFLPPFERIRLTVRWTSALPIRQALARQAAVQDEAFQPSASPSTSDEPVYRVTVAGVPVGLAVNTAGDFAVVTSLQRRGGNALHPTSVRFETAHELLNIEFTFPRDEPLTVAEREVRFWTEIGEGSIKATFHLDRMVLGGRLTL